MNWNWTNGPIYTSATGYQHATQGSGNIQNLTTYYTPNTTGYETTGTSTNVSDIGTYTYTVPFQTYQLNPGSTINMAVGRATPPKPERQGRLNGVPRLVKMKSKPAARERHACH